MDLQEYIGILESRIAKFEVHLKYETVDVNRTFKSGEITACLDEMKGELETSYKDFAKAMKRIFRHVDKELAHASAVTLMANTLKKLGFETGIKISMKWKGGTHD